MTANMAATSHSNVVNKITHLLKSGRLKKSGRFKINPF